MHLICLGLSHHSADTRLRERVAMDVDQTEELVHKIKAHNPRAEVVVLSTCNRTEIYVARPLHDAPSSDELLEWMIGSNLDPGLRDAIYKHEKTDAVSHLFAVCAGLDSMVIGETQIVSQLKSAYAHACELNAVGRTLHKVFQAAFAVSKKIRTQTGLGSLRLSVSSAAVDFASHLFDRLDDKTVLMVGAGEVGELTLRHFVNLKPGRVMVANRSIEKAEALAANANGEAYHLRDLDQVLVQADIVICSTGAKTPIISLQQLQSLLGKRHYRPLFLIDIAMPRDVEAGVGELQNVYLFNLDDLQASLLERREEMAGDMKVAQRMIDQAVGETYSMVQTGDFNHLIVALRDSLHELGENENQRSINRLIQAKDSDQIAKVLEEHTQRVVNKILHRPISELGKQSGTQAALYAAAIRRLFEINDPVQGDDLALGDVDPYDLIDQAIDESERAEREKRGHGQG